MAMQLPRKRFTVDEYHKMADAGILHEDDRVELIEGEIIEMSPINVPHAVCVDRLTKKLVMGAGDRAIVRVQSPIFINERTEPEPDLVLLKPRDYLAMPYHPGPDDIMLVIEVADSTVRTDRRDKVPRYARAGIPEMWLVNIPRKIVEVYSEPVEGKYRNVQRVGRGQTLSLTALPDVTIGVDEILG